MPIGVQTTIEPHTGNGVATVFSYGFGVLSADDLTVIVDGVEVTTGFTVSGIGSRAGGSVTFSAPPANGADILIVRQIVRKRDTDYQYSGDLREEVLDNDFDRIWMTLQEDGELVDRGVRVPIGETLSELPAAATRALRVLGFDSTGQPVMLTRTDDGGSALALDLLAPSGTEQIGFKLNYVSALGRLLSLKLSDWESVNDFYPDDTYSDDDAAFSAAWAALATSRRALYVPYKTGGYTLSAGFTIPAGCGMICAPGVLFTFTGTDAFGIRVKKACNVVGNGARLHFSNAAWDGFGIYLNGADIFADDDPTFIDGFNVSGNDISKGTAIGFEALNAGEFITFVRASNITGYTLNYLLTLNVGSSGSAGSIPTWHWINGNTFSNITGYSCTYGISMVGTNGTPAECNGNIFNGVQLSVNSTPIYIYGASGNFIDAQVFDWNYASGDAIIMEGGAVDNRVVSNIRVEGITGYATNFCETPLGEMTGSRTVVGDLDVQGYVATTDEIVSGGRVWIQGTNALQLGYLGLEASITGDATLLITPRSGYNVRVASPLNVSGNVEPFADNTHACGGASFRWTVVYAATGTINTSDERAKQDIRDLTIAERAVAIRIKGLLKAFRFKDAVAAKGSSARVHFGVVAQQVADAFTAEGLDADDYGLFCHDVWADVLDDDGTVIQPAGDRYGIRYEELLAFMLAAL